MPDAPEPTLVQQCLTGDSVALRAFVERFQNPIFSLCFRMLGQRQDAEDATQETFVRAIRNLSRWDGRPLLPWLLTIASNRCRTAWQQRSRLPRTTESDRDFVSATPQNSDTAEEVQLALNQLRDDHRHCFILFYQQELSVSEISGIMGAPEGTIKTWLHRARHELAEILKRRGFQPEQLS